MKDFAVLVLLAAATGLVGCGSGDASSDAVADAGAVAGSSSTRFDFSSASGASVAFNNQAMILRPTFGPASVAAVEGTNFGRGGDRLPCQAFGSTDALAENFFTVVGTPPPYHLSGPPASPVFLDSLSFEVLDDPVTHNPETEACYTYRTTDGAWHARLDPKPTVRDEAAHLSRATFAVGAEHVDLVAIVVGSGSIHSATLVGHVE